jgi:hypothetical protein
MKNIFIIFGIFFIGMSFMANPVKSQNIESVARKSKSAFMQKPVAISKVIGETKRANYFLTRRGLQHQNRSTNLEYIDTLNYPLAGTKALYTADNGGYVTGNNNFGDLAKANFYATTSTMSLTGILFDFAIAIGGNPSIEIVIWDNSGVNNSPGSIIASGSINLDIIKNDIANQLMTYVSFNPPVLLTTSFYAGFILPTSVGDTLAVYSNTDGDTNPGIAWEKWNTDDWYPISSNLTWSLDITMSIFPIVISETQIEMDTLNYPLAGEYGVYITEGNGYVSGNNEYGDLAKANFFPNNLNRTITGVLMEFVYATGGNPTIELAVWNNSGTGGSPGTKIGSQNISLNTIKTHINDEQATYVAFDPPVNVTSSFYAGFMLPTTTGDTLAIWSNTDGDTNPTTAWELWTNDQWHSFNGGEGTWELDIALAVYPIVQYTLGATENSIEELITIFPNPSHGFYTISSKLFKSESIRYSVYKSDGTIISSGINKDVDMVKIDLTSEPAGIYLLKVEVNSTHYFRKLMKR